MFDPRECDCDCASDHGSFSAAESSLWEDLDSLLQGAALVRHPSSWATMDYECELRFKIDNGVCFLIVLCFVEPTTILDRNGGYLSLHDFALALRSVERWKGEQEYLASPEEERPHAILLLHDILQIHATEQGLLESMDFVLILDDVEDHLGWVLDDWEVLRESYEAACGY